MARLSLTIVENAPRRDGTFTIKIRITNGSSVAYVTTKYAVEKRQWNGGQVVRHPQAASINAKLFQLLNAYQTKLGELNPPSDATATQIRNWLKQSATPAGSFTILAERYITRLKENGQSSYAQNMEYTLKAVTGFYGADVCLRDFSYISLELFERFMRQNGQSDTTINIRMSHLKALLNYAVTTGAVEYKIFPFRGYKMPRKNVREIWLSKGELRQLRDADFKGAWQRRYNVARDLFMLSFYFAGINLTDLIDAKLHGDTIDFVRKKTSAKKTGEKGVSLTIQPEARAIIEKYITKDGTLDFGYNFSDYKQFRSFITKGLNKIGENSGFENKLMYYSARKTFVQFGQQLGIPIYVLEYAVGQSIKDANSRPIFDYMRVMRFQADLAIRTIIDYTLNESTEDEIPIPEWARRR